jgi:phosphatidylglycerophosphate synthase
MASPPPGKPPEVEELVDEWLHRPPARRLVALLVRTPITPNQVTLLSAAVGASAGAVLWSAGRHPGHLILAAGLLFASVVLDCSDGQLARLKAIHSTYGAILDGIGDYVVGVALAIGASHYLVEVFGSRWYWLLGLAGTASAALHAALFDHAKTRYIAHAGRGYRERDDLDRVRVDRGRARLEGRWLDAFLLWLYERYSLAQEAALATPPARDPEAWRRANHGRMRAWTFLGTGTHFCLAYLLIAASYRWPGAVRLFFVAALIPFNLLLLWLAATEPRGERA